MRNVRVCVCLHFREYDSFDIMPAFRSSTAFRIHISSGTRIVVSFSLDANFQSITRYHLNSEVCIYFVDRSHTVWPVGAAQIIPNGISSCNTFKWFRVFSPLRRSCHCHYRIKTEHLPLQSYTQLFFLLLNYSYLGPRGQLNVQSSLQLFGRENRNIITYDRMKNLQLRNRIASS